MEDAIKNLAKTIRSKETPLVQVVEPEIRSVAKYALLGTPATGKKDTSSDK